MVVDDAGTGGHSSSRFMRIRAARARHDKTETIICAFHSIRTPNSKRIQTKRIVARCVDASMQHVPHAQCRCSVRNKCVFAFSQFRQRPRNASVPTIRQAFALKLGRILETKTNLANSRSLSHIYEITEDSHYGPIVASRKDAKFRFLIKIYFVLDSTKFE